MCNSSLGTGRFPADQKRAVVHPLLKKSSLDPQDAASYRPVSNLSFISKLLERVVAKKFTNHSTANDLLPKFQSSYRSHHSTETAITRIYNDVIQAVDQGHVVAMVLLDLSAAFDTVDHQILLDVLTKRFGVQGLSLGWFQSYLSDRSELLSYNGSQCVVSSTACGVPQGSVLGPIEFISYTEDVTSIFETLDIRYHIYADDKQLYEDGRVTEADAILSKLSGCVSEVSKWCASRRLQLNTSKTELIWFGSRANLDKLNSGNCCLSLGNVTIEPASSVRNLGVFLDSKLTLSHHVSHISKACYFHIRRLRQIIKFVNHDTAQQLFSSFVLSRLDYCNTVLAGLPNKSLNILQRVQNTAARVILNRRPRDHISDGLRELHWLPVKHRIRFKLCLTMHLIKTGKSPQYLADLVQPTSSTARAGLRSASALTYTKPRLKTRLGERGFAFAGPAAWNELPVALKQTDDTTTFKKLLKTHLSIPHSNECYTFLT